MSVYSGPNIPSNNNLAFAYDMSNTQKSWIGAPATNLLSVTADNVYTTLDTGNATYGPVSLISTPTPYGNSAYQITFKTTGDNGYYGTNTCRFTSNTVNITRDGTTYYKYSVWVYTENWADWENNVYKYVTGSNGLSSFSDSTQRLTDSLGRIWRRYWQTSQQIGGGGVVTEYHTFYKNGTLTSDLTVLLAAPDFYGESIGGYVANYVNGTRSNTQALLDIARNNTITANNLTYASDGTFSFNGSSNYMSTTISSFSMYCLNIWLYNNNAIPNNDTAIGGPSTYQTLVQFNNAYPTGINLGAWTGSMTNEAVQIWTGTSGSYTATYNQTAVPVGWHNIVFNWNGSNYDIWIDGAKTTTYTMSGGATLQTITSLQIGYSSPGYYFNGKIPIVSCYSSQLSDAQVIQNFNSLRSRFGL